MNISKKAVLIAFILAFTSISAQAQLANSSGRAKEEKAGKKSEKCYGADGKTVIKCDSAEAKALKNKYPEAERKEPERETTKIPKEWKKLGDASEKESTSQATFDAASAVIANEKANAYEKSMAAQIAAYYWIDKDDYDQALPLLGKAIEFNGLSNNSHYDVMYSYAQIQVSAEKYKDALVTLSRYMAETKTPPAKAYALRGNVYYQTEKYFDATGDLKKAVEMDPNADKSWQQTLMSAYVEAGKPDEAVKYAEGIVAKSPDDKAALMNLANIYLQADKQAMAAKTFDQIKAKGLLTETRDYETAYKLLANVDGREMEAVDVINEGLAKGKLTESAALYSFVGQTYYYAEKTDKAIEYWKKALPMAPDGEIALNLSKVLSQEDNNAQARIYLQQAMTKGVKKKGDAYMVLARIENETQNRPAYIAALKEAAKYPESQVQANKILKQIGVK